MLRSRRSKRAGELQELTAVLLRATTVADIATVILTRGLRAVQASRGYLLIVDDAGRDRLIAAAGYALGGAVTFVNTAGVLAPGREPPVLTTLPLLHGDEIIGRLALEWPESEACGLADGP